MTARTLLVRGMLVGLIAAGLAVAFAALFGEPEIVRAIAFESAHGAAEAGPVSRAMQATLGLGLVIAVYGAAIGGVFALAFAFVYGRVCPLGARATACWVAAVGFVAVAAVPSLKYPAGPPATGAEETIGRRTWLFFMMMLIAVLAAIAAVLIGRSMAARLGGWDAALTGIGAFVLLVGVAAALLPPVEEVPAGFPATVLWRFRVASLGTHLVLWAACGLLFGALTERAVRRAPARPVAAG